MDEKLSDVDIEDIIEACKEIKFKRFQEKVVEPIKNILSLENIDPRELFETKNKEKLEKFADKIKGRLKPKKEEPKELKEDKVQTGEELIISKLNEYHESFKQMEEKITEQRGREYGHIHPMTARLKSLTLMRILDFSTHTRFAEWIRENEELTKKLGFSYLPKTKIGISALFKQFEYAHKKHIPGEVDRIAEKIKNELKISGYPKEETKIPDKTSGEEPKEEWKPKCFNCDTSDFIKKDNEWKGTDEIKQIWKWICTNCGNSFVSEKKEAINENKLNKPSQEKRKDNDPEKPKEEKMKRHAWGLYNINGYKDYEEIASAVTEKFEEKISKLTVHRWIKEEREKRRGLTCGEMDCFSDPKKESDEKPRTKWCEGIGKMRGKDDYICNEKLKELIKNKDSRLLKRASKLN